MWESKGQGGKAGGLKPWDPPLTLVSALPDVSPSCHRDMEASQWQKHKAECQGTWTLAIFCQRVSWERSIVSGVSYLGSKFLGISSHVTPDKMPSVSLSFPISHMRPMIVSTLC